MLLVASDLFADSFKSHFGDHGSPQDRLLKNLKAADMRKLPFEPASFDAIISAYAMDHVGREGTKQALAEANRVS